jgi:hypothetical protein
MRDRVYAAPLGVSHVVRAHGDVVARVNRQALPLFERGGRRMNLLPFAGGLKGKTPKERRLKSGNRTPVAWRSAAITSRGGMTCGRRACAVCGMGNRA